MEFPMRTGWLRLLVLFGLSGLLVGSSTAADPADDLRFAVAAVRPVNASRVRGIVRMIWRHGECELSGRLNNLPPGNHLFSVRRFGDARSHDGLSTGPHRQPKSELPLTAGANGVAIIEQTWDGVSYDDLVGRSVVVQAGPPHRPIDGDRNQTHIIGVGVIGRGNPDWSYVRDRR